MMQLNAEFDRVVVLNTLELPWHPLAEGAEQRMLECAGTEHVRSTAIVRFEPDTVLPSLTEALGSEIIVLDGEFSADDSVFSAGTYVKNLPRAAYTRKGCVLFVKQGHLHSDDVEHVVVDVQNSHWRQGLVTGLSVMPLSDYKGEHSALVRWQPGTVFNPHRHWGGEEIYVMEGVFEDEFGRYPRGTWLRNPHLSQHAPFSHEGCTIFVKVGHLPDNN